MSARPVILRGKKVFLRGPAMRDFDEFARLMKASRHAYRGRMNPLQGRSQFKELVSRSHAKEHFLFLICDVSEDRIVGTISLFMIHRRSFQNGVVGYMVGVPYARRGFATEALNLILRFAFSQLKLHRVEANIQPDNTASRALARRAGFQCEGYSPRFLKIGGRWRDHERWAILFEDWREHRKAQTKIRKAKYERSHSQNARSATVF